MGDRRGRTTGKSGKENAGGFLALPHSVFRSREFRELSPYAVKLLIAVALQHDGRNNGALVVVHSQLREDGFRSKATLYKALEELVARGWLEMTTQGGRHKPSRYALTWRARDVRGEILGAGPASHLYRRDRAHQRDEGAEMPTRSLRRLVKPRESRSMTRANVVHDAGQSDEGVAQFGPRHGPVSGKSAIRLVHDTDRFVDIYQGGVSDPEPWNVEGALLA